MDKNEQRQVVETMQTPGWQVLVAMVDKLRRQLEDRIAPMAQRDDMLAEKIVAKQNYALGRVVGMKVFTGMPAKVMKALEAGAAEEKEQT